MGDFAGILSDDGRRIVIEDDEHEAQFEFPVESNATEAAIIGYRNGLLLGKRIGRSSLQIEMRRLIGCES